jgi:hypothetical protein
MRDLKYNINIEWLYYIYDNSEIQIVAILRGNTMSDPVHGLEMLELMTYNAGRTLTSKKLRTANFHHLRSVFTLEVAFYF